MLPGTLFKTTPSKETVKDLLGNMPKQDPIHLANCIFTHFLSIREGKARLSFLIENESTLMDLAQGYPDVLGPIDDRLKALSRILEFRI